MACDLKRRFGGTQVLYGEAAFTRFQAAHVVVAGVGGVGSWAAESLVRTGVGKLTLIDMDVVSESNTNRQLPALEPAFGELKTEVLRARFLQINPELQIQIRDAFVDKDNCAELLAGGVLGAPDVVLDCVDDGHAKLAMALYCRFNKVPLVVAGGAGGKVDPGKIQVSDLAKTTEDPLLARLRRRLRDAGVNRQLKENFGIQCVYSVETLKRSGDAAARLACGGFGSSVVVTASVGMRMAALALERLSGSRPKT